MDVDEVRVGAIASRAEYKVDPRAFVAWLGLRLA